jgi:hypothetical protein
MKYRVSNIIAAIKKLFTKNSRVKIGQRHLQARITFLFLKRVTGRIFTIIK